MYYILLHVKTIISKQTVGKKCFIFSYEASETSNTTYLYICVTAKMYNLWIMQNVTFNVTNKSGVTCFKQCHTCSIKIIFSLSQELVKMIVDRYVSYKIGYNDLMFAKARQVINMVFNCTFCKYWIPIMMLSICPSQELMNLCLPIEIKTDKKTIILK